MMEFIGLFLGILIVTLMALTSLMIVVMIFGGRDE